jgi:hypothetical protein
MKQLKLTLIYVLMASFSLLSFSHTANASLIGTQQIAAEQSKADGRKQLHTSLERPEVQAQLEKLGINKDDAQRRVASLTDDEVVALNNKIDSLPAGAGVVGAIVFIFLVLLVTDILGLTKVFPFTKSAR